jgi:hypothetical protein
LHIVQLRQNIYKDCGVEAPLDLGILNWEKAWKI